MQIYRFGDEKVGYCTVLAKQPPRCESPTWEDMAEVARNRQQIHSVLSQMESTAIGKPMAVTVDFRDDLYSNGDRRHWKISNELQKGWNQHDTDFQGAPADRPGVAGGHGRAGSVAAVPRFFFGLRHPQRSS